MSADSALDVMDFVCNSFDAKRKLAENQNAFVAQPAQRLIFGHRSADIAWFNVGAFVYLHVSAFCGAYLLLTGRVSLGAFVFGYLYGIFSAVGVTGGAHRLWAHGAYKAKWPLRLILIALQTAAFQNCIHEWVRDHRVHHKFTDTDADPHNYNRGFFFAHMGWLMVRKHPMVKQKGRQIDMSDIDRDPLCVFQRKYYLVLMPLLAFILPTYVNMAVFGQSFWLALHATNLRYMLSLHFAWLVNSAAHCWGHKPYDSAIKPVNNWFLALVIIGEGWHNYHHVFPWDYKAAEHGTYFLNFTTCFIDFFASFGWAYDLKSVSQPMIVRRAMRTGDGTFPAWKTKEMAADGGGGRGGGEEKASKRGIDANGNVDVTEADFSVDHRNMLWGWNDVDLPEQAKMYVDIRNRSE